MLMPQVSCVSSRHYLLGEESEGGGGEGGWGWGGMLGVSDCELYIGGV